MIRLILWKMNNSRSQNRRPQRSGNGTENAMVRAEEHKALKEELNKMKEQFGKLQEKLERTIHSKGQLLTLNCRLVEDLKMANMPLTQAYKLFEIRQKAELQQEIAKLAILNKVTKADHDAFKNCILSWLPPLLQDRRSTVKLMKKVSAKDSGLEIGTAPRMSRDMQLIIAENQALKYDVETLKDQLKRDQQLRQQMLLANAEMHHAAVGDSEPIPEKKGAVTSNMMADKRSVEGRVEDAITSDKMEGQDVQHEETQKVKEDGRVDSCQEDEAVFEKTNETKDETMTVNVEEASDRKIAIQDGSQSTKEVIVVENIAAEQAVQHEETQKLKEDGRVDSCQEDEAVFEETNETKDETMTVNVEEASDRKIAIQDGSQSTEEVIVVENIAAEQAVQHEETQKVKEDGREESGDQEAILQEDSIITQLLAVNERFQKVNEDAAELAEELELDKLSSELSYEAILKGMKDNIELKMFDHQNEVQQWELTVKEEKALREDEHAKVVALEEGLQQTQLELKAEKTLREGEQAKIKALDEELNKVKRESKALKDSQSAEIKNLRETVLDIGSRYSKAQDDYQEETKLVKTTLKDAAIKMKELIRANDSQKHEKNFLKERLARFSDKLDKETSLLREQLAGYNDKLDKEVQTRKGLEERNAELYTRLQEQEDVISELQAKKRRRKGWRRFIFCF